MVKKLGVVGSGIMGRGIAHVAALNGFEVVMEDINMTFLVKPNIILYSSLTNILGRNNVFNYKYSTDLDVNNTYSRVPVISSRERFFFIGVFISLNNTKAYEVSNF